MPQIATDINIIFEHINLKFNVSENVQPIVFNLLALKVDNTHLKGDFVT